MWAQLRLAIKLRASVLVVGSSASPVPSASLLILAGVVGPVVLLRVIVVAGVGLVAMAVSLWVPVNLI